MPTFFNADIYENLIIDQAPAITKEKTKTDNKRAQRPPTAQQANQTTRAKEPQVTDVFFLSLLPRSELGWAALAHRPTYDSSSSWSASRSSCS